jgi:RHS repeat-associated protein
MVNYHIKIKNRLKEVLLAFSFILSAFSSRAQLVGPTMTGTPVPGSYYNYSSITLTNFSFTATAGNSLKLYIASPDCQQLNAMPSAGQNYIKTSIPRTQITDPSTLAGRSTCDLMQTIQYFDGLGRPLQTVQVKGSPNGYDIVQPFVYDQYGRAAQKYLPYAATTSDGSYKTDAFSAGAGISNFYNSTGTSGAQQTNGIVVNPAPFAQTGFEPSPLNRAIEQGAPGTPWQVVAGGAGHTVKIAYGANNVTAYTADPVNGTQAALYNVTINTADQSRTLVPGGYYTAGALYVTTTKDENWVSGRAGTTEEYKDQEGHVVLKRVYNTDPITPVLSTYYVYDDLGNLAFVLPPAANGDAAAVIPPATLDNYCYQYRYDERNRLIEKKIPGKGWELMAYNTLDQLVATQDANQRALSPQQWTFNKYDGQGRAVISGIYLYTGTTGTNYRIAVQTAVNSITALWETPIATGNGYTNAAWPVNWTGDTLTLNYYDNYTFPSNPYTAFTSSTSFTNATGLLTGTKTAILNPDGSIGQMLWAIHGYDGLGREIQSVKQHYQGGSANYNTGNFDIRSTFYDFDNQVDHYNYAHVQVGIVNPKVGGGDKYYYDHMGRLTQTYKVIWDESLQQPSGTLLSQLDYNEIGQVKTKHLHQNSNGQFVQDINYTYNERGWLNSINNPAAVSSTQVFGEQLQYNAGSAPQYNGNISGMSWQTMVPAGAGLTQAQQNYAYSYDNLNRLMLANYTTPGSVAKFNEQIVAYDPMGNITGLKRTNSTTAGVYLNNLTYDYTSGGTGNKLWGVTDAGTAAQGGTYTYDGNGNALTDTRNQITNIKYNLLNLPATVTRTGGNITYTYDAAGNKLQKVSGGITREYIGDIEYNNGTVELVKTEEGRATLSGSTYIYEYYLKDHLGNTRAAVKQDGTITQVQDYYAFGMDMNPGNAYTGNPLNNYKYNGKEKQAETGGYDYGARFYDPVIGRWGVVDADAEDFEHLSPYNYGENNPILMIDPDGNAADSTNKPKPPVELPQVDINGLIPVKHVTIFGTYTEYRYPEAVRIKLRDQFNDLLSRYTPAGREVMLSVNLWDLLKNVKFSKIGTPRAKSAARLRKEWEKATGKKWPKEPGNPNRNQVAHHIKALADGGEDGYPNIEPMPANEHRSLHQMLGDFIRWGSKRVEDVN